jgi:hypothetical protein
MVGNAGELGGPAELRIESLTTEGTFTTKKGNDYRVQHAVRIEIPNEPRWAGKTVRVFIQLLLENPDKQAVIRESSVGEPVAIPVAPEGAGPMYRSSWRVALFGGALPAVLVGFVLARLAGPPQPKRSAPAAVAPSATKPTA